MSNKLYFVTSNKDKVAEAQAILPIPLEIALIEVDEVQSLDLTTVVRKKTEKAFDVLHKPLFVDDVGFYIEAWKGFPGPFIKYLREAGGNDLLLYMLKHEKNRSVVAKAAIGYHDGKTIEIFMGEIKGVITMNSRGSDGWGFDPLFQPEDSTQTFAEMGSIEKNTRSHRRRALEKFKAFLDNHPLTP